MNDGFRVGSRFGFLSGLRRRRRGSAMVMAVVFTAVVGSTVSYVMLASNRQTRNTFRARLMDTSLSAAATAVANMSQQAYFLASTRPAQMGGNWSQLDNIIQSVQPRKLPGYLPAKQDEKSLAFMRPAGTNGVSSVISDPADDWNGFNIRRWTYDVVAFMNAADQSNGSEVDPVAQRLGFEGAGFQSRLTINYIPLYQYAIFYDNDLEFHPGANMAVDGPVHSNRNLWLGAGGSNHLKFNSRISSAGDVRSYRDFLGVSGSTIGALNYKMSNGTMWKPEGSDHPGDVYVRNAKGQEVKINNTDNIGDTNKNTFLDSLDSNWMETALERFGGKLTDKAMGDKVIQPPLPFVGEGTDRKQADAADLIQRLDNPNVAPSDDLNRAKMEAFADVRIVADPSKVDKDGYLTDITFETATGYDGEGVATGWQANTITNRKLDSKGKPTGKPIVGAGSFYDYRQNRTVKTMDLDMGEMQARAEVKGVLASGNGVVYVSTKNNTDSGSNPMKSVRVQNAATLPTSAANTLTIATDRPMYLEGDVNKHSDASKRATLLLAADAMTVTSKKLTDSTGINSAASKSVETNAIFMLGQVSSKYQTAGSDGKLTGSAKDNTIDHFQDGYRRKQWSGGVHNVIRYLESWSGKTHTYNGSLICLFESQVATFRHESALAPDYDDKYYGAPNRNFTWDSQLSVREPPKGMPVLVQVQMTPLQRIGKAQAVALAE